MENNLNLLRDVNINIEVEFGSTHRTIKDILAFSPGTIVELDELINSPVKILSNGKLIGTGEVVIVNDCYGVRILSLNKE